jgi:hypothetical protein
MPGDGSTSLRRVERSSIEATRIAPTRGGIPLFQYMYNDSYEAAAKLMLSIESRALQNFL